MPGPPYDPSLGAWENGLPPNPFANIDVGSNAAPAFLDIDMDGDLDMLIGTVNGGNLFYENIGSATAPHYQIQFSEDNPAFGMVVGGYASIGVGDVDGDGDYDVYISGTEAVPLLLENNSTRGNITKKELLFIERGVGRMNPLFIQKFGYGEPMKAHS